ncbi:MAG TPA: tyrosine decarboxylase MfnA, partial [Thermoplasmata archaeon]|nr:tyrosine decarboxylase MfnA [Thermoplasmata archaeon]
MREHGLPEVEVRALLADFHRMDSHFSDGRVFGSMCTEPHPLAIEAHMRFIEANLGNAGLYPGTAEMERQVIHMIGSLLHHPSASGQVVSGGTEANITALWIARNLSRRREVIFPASAHFSFEKAV